MIIDNDLKFETHMRNICKKTAQKLGVLNKISSFLDPEKKKNLYLMWIGALIWMCLKLSINMDL